MRTVLLEGGERAQKIVLGLDDTDYPWGDEDKSRDRLEENRRNEATRIAEVVIEEKGIDSDTSSRHGREPMEKRRSLKWNLRRGRHSD